MTVIQKMWINSLLTFSYVKQQSLKSCTEFINIEVGASGGFHVHLRKNIQATSRRDSVGADVFRQRQVFISLRLV